MRREEIFVWNGDRWNVEIGNTMDLRKVDLKKGGCAL